MLDEKLNAALNPADAQDEFTQAIREMGYLGAKRLPDGTYVAANRLMYTMAIFINIGPLSFQQRYCFEDFSEFLANYEALEAIDSPVSGYVASRP